MYSPTYLCHGVYQLHSQSQEFLQSHIGQAHILQMSKASHTCINTENNDNKIDQNHTLIIRMLF